MAGGKHEQNLKTRSKSQAHLGSGYVRSAKSFQEWLKQIRLFPAARPLSISSNSVIILDGSGFGSPPYNANDLQGANRFIRVDGAEGHGFDQVSLSMDSLLLSEKVPRSVGTCEVEKVLGNDAGPPGRVVTLPRVPKRSQYQPESSFRCL